MLEKLSETRNRLLEQSYSAGIAEMAAGVLHTIRNQLAPLSLRLGRLQQALDQSAEGKLGRAFDELKSATLPAERKQKVLQYVELSCKNATDRQHNTVSELKGIADDLVRIEHVLHDLDRFSRKDDTVAEVRLIDLVRETVDVLPKFPDIEVVIRIDPRMEDCPTVATDPFILRHVLQNLIINAIESMMAAGKKQGTIGIRAIATTGGAGPAMDLQVEDDGIGIPADKLDTIFVRGFSTKQGNRRGTGLHWCANSMLAIGGRVFAESPGAGCGATMHLIVPVPPAAKRAAA
jgi:signal transduction histidine kinase